MEQAESLAWASQRNDQHKRDRQYRTYPETCFASRNISWHDDETHGRATGLDLSTRAGCAAESKRRKAADGQTQGHCGHLLDPRQRCEVERSAATLRQQERGASMVPNLGAGGRVRASDA